ncbi:MAG TPA: cysteine desulfurase [Planctomycetota bacterium]|nr:cysteine desulfurase [Planctomycetota bacterium]
MHRVAARPAFDVETVRRDFPILEGRVWCKPLVYLDNAATSQKPRAVLEALDRYYKEHNSNVHRGVHWLSAAATKDYEGARDKVRDWIRAAAREEIVFTRGTTESINLVARSFARPRLKPGDEILVTEMEHHSNIVPWQLVCEEAGAKLRVVPINDRGELRFDEKLLTPRTRLFAFVHVSNALGTVNPVRELVRAARARGIPTLVDGAQAMPHGRVDVQDLGCDFYVFSGHKVFGPTGIGVLYGRRELLDAMPPYQGGGEMIKRVTFEKTTWNDLPYKFEAGTPDIAGAVGLGAALDYLATLDGEAVRAHEESLLARATAALSAIHGLRIIGEARHKASLVTFAMEGVHPHDVGQILDQEGVAVRTGHHCAQPVMDRFGVPATTRASFAFYNTLADVDALVAALAKVRELFA